MLASFTLLSESSLGYSTQLGFIIVVSIIKVLAPFQRQCNLHLPFMFPPSKPWWFQTFCSIHVSTFWFLFIEYFDEVQMVSWSHHPSLHHVYLPRISRNKACRRARRCEHKASQLRGRAGSPALFYFMQVLLQVLSMTIIPCENNMSNSQRASKSFINLALRINKN